MRKPHAIGTASEAASISWKQNRSVVGACSRTKSSSGPRTTAPEIERDDPHVRGGSVADAARRRSTGGGKRVRSNASGCARSGTVTGVSDGRPTQAGAVRAAPWRQRRPDTLVRRARLAEEVGFESLWIGDHIALPAGDKAFAAYPPDQPRLEAIVALAYMAAVTSRSPARGRRDRAAPAAAGPARQAALDHRRALEGAADRRDRGRVHGAGARALGTSLAERAPERTSTWRRCGRSGPSRCGAVVRGAVRVVLRRGRATGRSSSRTRRS